MTSWCSEMIRVVERSFKTYCDVAGCYEGNSGRCSGGLWSGCGSCLMFFVKARDAVADVFFLRGI